MYVIFDIKYIKTYVVSTLVYIEQAGALLDLTFEEERLWVSLLSIGALYGGYFYEVASGAQQPSLSAMQEADATMASSSVLQNTLRASPQPGRHR